MVYCTELAVLIYSRLAAWWDYIWGKIFLLSFVCHNNSHAWLSKPSEHPVLLVKVIGCSLFGNSFVLWADCLGLAQGSSLCRSTDIGNPPFSPFLLWLSSAIGYCAPMKGGRVSSRSLLGGLRGWGSSLVFWFSKWNSRLSSAWPAVEGTDARLGAVAGAKQTPGCVGKVNLVWHLEIWNCCFNLCEHPWASAWQSRHASESWCESGVQGQKVGRLLCVGYLFVLFFLSFCIVSSQNNLLIWKSVIWCTPFML
jgi:hypothetical protein